MTHNDVSERQFQRCVIELAQLHRWLHYHTYDSRRSAPGFPDLVLARGDRTIFAELKTERGRVSMSQRRWLDTLACGPAECYTWRPSDWPDIETALA